jgi:hypothetical protein
MRFHIGTMAAICALPSAALAQSCPDTGTMVFAGADVLTMTDSVLRRSQDVVIRDGRIVSLGAAGSAQGGCRIDARGKVLLPGLADMHVHTNEREMPLFLANGVTLVREMNGSPTHVRLRGRIAAGEVLGPRLLVTSPLLVGEPLRYRHRLVTGEQDAYAAAHEAHEAGYDFLKIYEGLKPVEYAALVRAAKTLTMPLDGHVPAAVGLERVLASGQALQHMDKIAVALAGHPPDASKLNEARRLFAGKRVWITPTLASLRILDRAGTAEYAARFQRPEMAFVDSGTVGWWRSLVRGGNRTAVASPMYRFEQALLRALEESGARFLAGTDAGNPMMVAGFSLHEELQVLVDDGGFSRWEVLQFATRNAAQFLSDSLGGVIKPGARAELILVDANPLSDLATLKRPTGVLVYRKWLDRARLDALLATVR